MDLGHCPTVHKILHIFQRNLLLLVRFSKYNFIRKCVYRLSCTSEVVAKKRAHRLDFPALLKQISWPRVRWACDSGRKDVNTKQRQWLVSAWYSSYEVVCSQGSSQQLCRVVAFSCTTIYIRNFVQNQVLNTILILLNHLINFLKIIRFQFSSYIYTNFHQKKMNKHKRTNTPYPQYRNNLRFVMKVYEFKKANNDIRINL